MRVIRIAVLTTIGPYLCACTCVWPGNVDPVKEEVKQADFILQGKIGRVEVFESSEQRRRFRLTLDVSRIWKGDVGEKFDLYSMVSGTDCMGFSSEIGKEFLVFASKQAADDHWLDGTDSHGKSFRKLWYGWLDVLSKGQIIAVPTPCSFSAEVTTPSANNTLKQLGNGRRP